MAGKFLFAGDEKFYVRGVTYGPFRPDLAGCEYGDEARVARDFLHMQASGINAVRTYTVPPPWLLDSAQAHGLRVLVGIPWEQHITFLDGGDSGRSIVQRAGAAVRACAGHRAVLGYTVGNEIPAPIVRWYGPRRIERFIRRLYDAAKDADPEGLVTYVNFPTTEYLVLPFLDFVSFNVYLETRERLSAYLARVQNLAGARPLVMGEIGLDSRRNGESGQTEVLDWQVRASYEAGCAGAFVFAWTDEWHRGGYDIEDWDFGLTRRDRRPKPALAAVSRAFQDAPFPADRPRPRISVVVCSYNGNATLAETLQGITRLEYPDHEVIVVDDGSRVPLAPIAEEFGVRCIRTPNRGLSSARNTGLAAATGEIIAYIDDDAYPDRHWLAYLAETFVTTDYAGVGGPNLAPPHTGPVADCVANSPGGPMHVLLSDTEAEHIPGCNMAFRRSALQSLGGFDERFHVAGDDVDLCWRLQAAGMKLGFNPAALVWHHRRNTIRGYWRQQLGYGRAEAMLERKWPEKYNETGHIPWAGRIYADWMGRVFGRSQGRIYHGTWGTALFQSLYRSPPTALASLLAMPEWYLIIAALALATVLGFFWAPLLLASPFLAAAVGLLVVRTVMTVHGMTFPSRPRGFLSRAKRYTLTAALHLMQPVARLVGRVREGLTPWRRPSAGHVLPWDRESTVWSDHWQAPEAWLAGLEKRLQAVRAVTLRGGDYDRWDLEVRAGMIGGARLLMTIEEHGAGRQLVRIRSWIRSSPAALRLAFFFDCIAVASLYGTHPIVPVVTFGLVVLIVAHALWDGSAAVAAIQRAVDGMAESAAPSRSREATLVHSSTMEAASR